MAKAPRTRVDRIVEDEPSPRRESLGQALRTLRQQSGRSLAEVAGAVDMSASFLSLVENDKSDISIGRLTRLVQFFGVSITELLPHPPVAEADVVRKSERSQLRSPMERIDIYLLTPETSRSLMAMMLEFAPGTGRHEYGQHAGEEFVHVLDGELLLELEGSDPHHLYAGDSAHYSAQRPHLLVNASDSAPLSVICVDSTQML